MLSFIHQDFPTLRVEHNEDKLNPVVYVKEADSGEMLASIVCEENVHLMFKSALFKLDMRFEDRLRLFVQIYGHAYNYSLSHGKEGHFDLHFQMGGAMTPQSLTQIFACATPQLRGLYGQA